MIMIEVSMEYYRRMNYTIWKENNSVRIDYYNYNSNLESYLNHEIAFVLFVWLDWTTEWYMSKNHRMGWKIVTKYWYPVAIVENPKCSWDYSEEYFDKAINLINEKFWCSKLYIMWYSAWGNFVWRYAYKYSEIKWILLVNPVLRVNNTKLIKWLNEFNWEWTILMWDKDPDFFYFPLLEKLNNNIDLIKLPWVGHQFDYEWGLEDYEELPLKYLFK